MQRAHRRARGAVRARVGVDHRPGRVRAGAGRRVDVPADADRSSGALAPGAAASSRSTASTTATSPRRCAACCSASTAPTSPPPDDPDEFHDHQLVGLAVVDRRRRAARRGGPDRPRARRPTCWCWPRPDGGTGAGPVRQGDRARGRPGRRPGRRRPARGPVRPVGVMRVDIVSIFPEYFAPLDLSLIGRARAAGLLDWPCTTCAPGPPTCTAPSTTPRTAAGPGMVMRPEPWGEALDALAGAGVARWSCRRRPAGRSPRRGAHELAAASHLIFACGRYEGIDQRVLDHAADPDAGHARCRSATTCSSAARSRCW